MNFEEFENAARLYVVGALDPDELESFREARREFGEAGEDIIGECRRLNLAFALTLHPQDPHPETRGKLLDKVHSSIRGSGTGAGNPV